MNHIRFLFGFTIGYNTRIVKNTASQLKYKNDLHNTQISKNIKVSDYSSYGKQFIYDVIRKIHKRISSIVH